MKKNLKKLFAILMTVAVVLSMAMPVLASDSVENNLTGSTTNAPLGEDTPTTGSLTVEEGDVTTTFTMYKVLDAAVVAPNRTYTWTVNSAWAGYSSMPTIEALAAMGASDLHDLANGLAKYADDNSIKWVDNNVGVGTKSNLELGYYLLVDNGGEGLEKSQPILVAIPQAHGDVWKYNITVKPKSSKTTFEKKILDGGELKDMNTANIGDLVEYRLWADIPNYDEEAESIVFTITDTMSNGLTWNSDTNKFAVYTLTAADNDSIIGVGGEGSTAQKQMTGFTSVFPDNGEKGGKFTVTFDTDFVKEHGGEVVVITFKAELNEDAVIAGTGNPNNAELEYSNNYYGGSVTEKIPDEVKTYTFKIDLKKVNEEDEGLNGAEFTVYSDASLGTEYKNDAFKNPLVTTGEGDEKGTAVVSGVKPGKYYLVETKAPDGYNVYNGTIVVEVIQSEDNPGEYTYTVTMDKEDPNQTVVKVTDKKGTTLPGTGGIGTTIFTFGGLALIVLAGILLVVYTRKQKKA